MNLNELKYELQNILSGKSGSSNDAIIQAAANYLKNGEKTSSMVEEKLQSKKQEEERLINFARKNDILFKKINEDNYISSGAEQKVYIKNEEKVLKLNDAIYYNSWVDYFNNLLLNNFFFSDTAYKLKGFFLNCNILYAVVQQSFIKADEITDLSNVKKFMHSNGFINTRRNDYYHPKLGIILEDLHDENVLTYKGILYFIDTVFYIDKDIFWTE